MVQKMNTLDQWKSEAESRHDYLLNAQIDSTEDLIPDQVSCERILALIDLIEKKDAAIFAMLTRNSIYEGEAKVAREALALTEQLK